MAKRKRTNNDLQNTTQKTEDFVTRAIQNDRGVNSVGPEWSCLLLITMPFNYVQLRVTASEYSHWFTFSLLVISLDLALLVSNVNTSLDK
jgi:hypothetical protein